MHCGVVLKNYAPLKQKLTMLDSKLGKIDCIYYYKKFKNKYKFNIVSTGAILCYNLEEKSGLFVLDDIEQDYIPYEIARYNLLFLHHVLELCYYFLPYHEPAVDIFNLLIELYQGVQCYLTYKIFLCRFFKILSIYPQDISGYTSTFLSLISTINNSKVNYQHFTLKENKEEFKRDVKKWLLECIYTHSHCGYFKTLGFIKQL